MPTESLQSHPETATTLLSAMPLAEQLGPLAARRYPAPTSEMAAVTEAWYAVEMGIAACSPEGVGLAERIVEPLLTDRGVSADVRYQAGLLHAYAPALSHRATGAVSIPRQAKDNTGRRLVRMIAARVDANGYPDGNKTARNQAVTLTALALSTRGRLIMPASIREQYGNDEKGQHTAYVLKDGIKIPFKLVECDPRPTQARSIARVSVLLALNPYNDQARTGFLTAINPGFADRDLRQRRMEAAAHTAGVLIAGLRRSWLPTEVNFIQKQSWALGDEIRKVEQQTMARMIPRRRHPA